MRIADFVSLLLITLGGIAAEPDNFRLPKDEDDLRCWLENMVWHHRFTPAEITAATGLPADKIEGALERLHIRPDNRPQRPADAPLKVLPYPGGRHPRIGFLEGAVRPQRETKVSVFTPWDESSYVVVDVPEAIWLNTAGGRELLYLAHTHIQTMWDRQGVKLEATEWHRGADGTLSLTRRLPNRIAFGTKVTPGRDAVRMEMWLTNGTDQTLTGMDVQNCVMLKGAAGFAQQSDANKIDYKPYRVCHSEDRRRWIITAWDPCVRAWGNPECPCLHSDPRFADCAAGETKRIHGWLSFYEGADIEGELRRIEASGWRKGVAVGRPQVQFVVVDESDKPVPCRIHLKDQAGKPQRAGKLPFWHDHFVCTGNVELPLGSGKYDFEAERGPEYERQAGSFVVEESTGTTVPVRLKRLVDLAAEGWFCGDLHVHRPPEDMELLMRAEDVYVAPVITWWNNTNPWTNRQLPQNPLVQFDGNRFYQIMAGEDERQGGALLFFNRSRPLAITGSGPEYPSPMKFVVAARQEPGTWVDVEKPFWWDVPVWVASGQIDSIGLANNHMCRSSMYENEAWGRPRDPKRLPPPLGNGQWSLEIYYHLLDCGLRIPPSAGSASGVLPNPLGYNRVYVHVGKGFTYPKWWEGLKAGRSFVTNGPLLLCRANGELPGHVFSAAAGEEVNIAVRASVTALDRIPAVEIVKNGHVERAVPMDELRKTGSLGTLSFRENGWFLVRAITDNQRTFRFASTAPFYVEVGPVKQRISKESAQFFLGWVEERMKQLPEKLRNPAQLREVLAYHEQARKSWQDLATRANAP